MVPGAVCGTYVQLLLLLYSYCLTRRSGNRKQYVLLKSWDTVVMKERGCLLSPSPLRTHTAADTRTAVCRVAVHQVALLVYHTYEHTTTAVVVGARLDTPMLYSVVPV